MRLSEPDRRRSDPRILAVLVAISLVITTAYFREGDDGMLHRTRVRVLALTAPFSGIGETLARPFDAVSDFLADLTVSREDLDLLQTQNDELRERLAELEEARQENDRLRALIDFAEQSKLSSLGARVIGRPASSWDGVVVIDRGSEDGVAVGMPVIAAQGLLGQVEEVAGHSSRVRLVTDQRSGVAAIVQSSRAPGIVRGSIDRELTMEFVDPDLAPVVGDVVITSGLGGVYPKGLIVGDVTRVVVHESSLHPEVYLSSRVPLDEIEEVLVIVGVVNVTGTDDVE